MTATPSLPDTGLPLFIVSVEATGFTARPFPESTDLDEAALAAANARLHTDYGLPTEVVALVDGWISEDDDQGEDPLHVFYRLDFAVHAADEEAAEALFSERLARSVSDILIEANAAPGRDWECEDNWEVAWVDEPEEAAAAL